MNKKPALDAVDFAALFQFVMTRGDDAVMLFDKQGHVRYANPAACKRLGYPNEALTQLQIFDLEEELNMVRYLQRPGSSNGGFSLVRLNFSGYRARFSKAPPLHYFAVSFHQQAPSRA